MRLEASNLTNELARTRGRHEELENQLEAATREARARDMEIKVRPLLAPGHGDQGEKIGSWRRRLKGPVIKFHI